MLENAVAPIEALGVVKNQGNQLKTHLGRNLDHYTYSNLVVSVVVNYDMQFKIKELKLSYKVYYYQSVSLWFRK